MTDPLPDTWTPTYVAMPPIAIPVTVRGPQLAECRAVRLEARPYMPIWRPLDHARMGVCEYAEAVEEWRK